MDSKTNKMDWKQKMNRALNYTKPLNLLSDFLTPLKENKRYLLNV